MAGKNQKELLNRIARLEGQVKGIKKMVEEDKECVDVIMQINAIKQAVNALGVEMLKNDFCKRSGNKIDEKYLKTLFKFN